MKGLDEHCRSNTLNYIGILWNKSKLSSYRDQRRSLKSKCSQKIDPKIDLRLQIKFPAYRN